MGRIDSISQALETEHGFDLSTGKLVNVADHEAKKIEEAKKVESVETVEVVENRTLPADFLKGLEEDDGELIVFGDEDDDEDDEDKPKKAELVVAQPMDEDEIDFRKDEELVKENIRTLIDKSMDMADELIEIVRISESPKSFDSAANFLRAIADLNDRLLEVHERKDKRKNNKKTGSAAQNNTPAAAPVSNTQNNTIICKDPAELLKMLNSE